MHCWTDLSVFTLLYFRRSTVHSPENIGKNRNGIAFPIPRTTVLHLVVGAHGIIPYRPLEQPRFCLHTPLLRQGSQVLFDP